MMLLKRRKFFFYLVFFMVGVGTFFFLRTCYSSPQEKSLMSGVNKEEIQFSLPVGEKITYAISSLALNVGEATLSFEGITELDGKKVFLIQFSANAVNFIDEEKIYADIETFYPLVVERNLDIWGKKEKIIEEYDHSKGIVKITKYVGEKITEEILEKEGKIDNIYCFIYRYRRSGGFQEGDSLLIRLPTKDVTLQLVKTTKLKAAGQVYKAYYMRSKTSGYKIWFDTSEKKIPLRISGTVGLSAVLTMTSYEEEEI